MGALLYEFGWSSGEGSRLKLQIGGRAIAIRMVFKAMSLEVTMGVREGREKEDQGLSPQIPQSYKVREKGIIQ